MDLDSGFYGIEIPTTKHSKGFSDELQGEFRKIRPPNFNGESKE